MCKKRFSELATREQQNQDGHHVLEFRKGFNPSEWQGKSLEEQRQENRKILVSVSCKICPVRVCKSNFFHSRCAKSAMEVSPTTMRGTSGFGK